MNSNIFIMYLLYGAVYIYLGMFSISQRRETLSQNIFIKSLYLLGLFGLFHGISEWINVILLTGYYSSFYNPLLIVKQLFKALSFVSLAFFGLKLNDQKRLNKIGTVTIVLIFFFWFIGFLYWIQEPIRIESAFYSIYNSIVLRYMLAFFSAILTSLGFYRRAKLIHVRKFKFVSSEYFKLSLIFIIYAFVEGILIKEQFFFPANIVNREVFLEVFKIPVQVIKIIIGIFINISLSKIVNSFYWEQQEKINQLISEKAVFDERQRMSFEIHDGIMQSLYAIGMKVEVLIKSTSENKFTTILSDIKENLNETLLTLRHLISANTAKTVEFQNLKAQIEILIDQYKLSTSLQFHMVIDASEHLTRMISTQKSTHIYYIIQEAIINGIKHAYAINIYISVKADENNVLIIIRDDGSGFNPEEISRNSFGLSLMKRRAIDLKAQIKIDSGLTGSCINIVVPWEALNE